MIVGLGLDLIELARIRAVYERHKDRFVARILTQAERDYVLRYADPVPSLAGRWAAKEAALKALGTGLAGGVGWHDVEILPDERGKPVLKLHRLAAERAQSLNADAWHVSITHSAVFAAATVVLEHT